MRKSFFPAVVTFLFTSLFFMLQNAYAVNIDKIIVFGDSLSDNGNIFALTTNAHKLFPSVPVLPKNPPYYEGRFTNGPVWVENLAASLNVPLQDHAYGGAWAEPLKDSKIVVPFGIGMQVSYYLVTAATDFHKGNHLYIIWIGGNDYLDGREDADYATTNTISSIETQMRRLAFYGAKNILILNLPDLSIVPEVVKKGPNGIQALHKIVTMHNEKLAKMVADFQVQHKDLKIIYGDITKYFNDVYHHPEKYNIKNVTGSCYEGNYSLRSLIAEREISAAKAQNIDIMKNTALRVAYATSKLADSGVDACATPDEYMFWDQIHPTRVLHNLMSLNAATILSDNDIHGAALSR